jgi:hypothetical protein
VAVERVEQRIGPRMMRAKCAAVQRRQIRLFVPSGRAKRTAAGGQACQRHNGATSERARVSVRAIECRVGRAPYDMRGVLTARGADNQRHGDRTMRRRKWRPNESCREMPADAGRRPRGVALPPHARFRVHIGADRRAFTNRSTTTFKPIRARTTPLHGRACRSQPLGAKWPRCAANLACGHR